MTEIQVMQTILDALLSLEDIAAAQRVLRWINARIEAEAALSQGQGAGASDEGERK